MSAIVTPTFRRNSVGDFKAGIDDENNNYFIGIGRLIPWPNNPPLTANGDPISEESSLFAEPLPQVTLAEELDVRNELMTLVKIQGDASSVVIPRNEWSTGRKYKLYDPTDPLTFEKEGNLYPCVTVSDKKIYLCVENGEFDGSIPNSSERPDVDNQSYQSATQRVGFNRGDGYVWVYLADMLNNSLDNDQFVSISSDTLVNASDQSPAPLDGLDLRDDAKDATGGLVYSFKIEETTSTVDLTTLVLVLEGINESGTKIADVLIHDKGDVNGSGTAAPFKIEGPLSGGGLERIKYTNANGQANAYQNAPIGYKKATVTAYSEDSNGVRTKIDGIKITPLLAPIDGFGYDIKTTTAAHYIGLHARFAESVDGEALTTGAYRQISVIKNPQRRTDQSPDDSNNINPALRYDDEVAIDCLDYIQLDANETNLNVAFDPGTTIVQENSGARARVAHVDVLGKRIYFQQQDQHESNFLPFTTNSADNITLTQGSITATIDGSDISHIAESEYIHDTGEVLFVDNRKRINRNNDQIEDLRIVIQF